MESKEMQSSSSSDLSRVSIEMHSSSSTIFEILTRVSLDTLLHQCQWVCTDWQKLMYQTNFKLMHSQRTQTVRGYFIESLEGFCKYHYNFVSIVDHSPQIPSPSLDFLPRNTKIEASSGDGLLCCIKNNSNIPRRPIYYICKPTTREWRKIPNPRTRFITEIMAMVVKQSHPRLDYKIIRFSRPKTILGYHCEMFDSNTWAWRRLVDIKLPHGVFLNLGGGIFVNGGFHWLSSDDHVFVFDVGQENWTTIDLPQNQELLDMDKKLVFCEGKIGVIFTTKEWMKLWILDNYHTHENIWKKKYDVDLRSLHRNTRYSWLLDMYSADTALLRNSADEVIWYNCNNDTYTTTKLPSKSIVKVFSFESDLVPCSLRS